MPRTTKVETPEEPRVELVKARTEGLKILSPFKSLVEGYTIDTEEEYLDASQDLSKVQNAIKVWTEKMEPIIRPQKQALDAAYKLKRDIIDPLNEAVEKIKTAMIEFKRAEQRRLQAAEQERQRLIDQAEAEARRKEEMADKAKSDAFKEKLLQQRAEAEQKVEDLKNQGPAVGVKATTSTDRKIKKWMVSDFAMLLQHIIEQEDDSLFALIQIDQVQMNAKFRLDQPALGKKWMPGIEVYEDFEIAGRASK